MTKAAAINKFWNSFGLMAYEENSVPDDAEFPYITYQLVTDSFDNETLLTASIWYRGTSWVNANAKAEEISQTMGRSGTLLVCDGGKIWLKRGTPFSQSMGDDTDDAIKRKYLNVIAEYFTAD